MKVRVMKFGGVTPKNKRTLRTTAAADSGFVWACGRLTIAGGAWLACGCDERHFCDEANYVRPYSGLTLAVGTSGGGIRHGKIAFDAYFVNNGDRAAPHADIE